jgi:pimeloyl-ACP methyl ester carboxylesterase
MPRLSVRPRPLLAAILLVAALAAVLAPAAVAVPPLAPPGPLPSPEQTSPLEAARVDSVPAPVLDWRPCGKTECARAQVPLDYDEPQGEQIELSLARLKASNPKRRIGSLFINPGGPGLTGVGYAKFGPKYFQPELLERFDLIGIDPRGTNASSPLRCFPSLTKAGEDLEGLLATPFPVSRAETAAALRSARLTAEACSRQPIASSMSTAEFARDMDVIRRALGEPKLNYYGESYGSFAGQVYANLFPDRFRALVIDGVIEPRGWVGLRDFEQPTFDRVYSPAASFRSFDGILSRCKAAGERRCAFAAGDPYARFEALAGQLRAEPLELNLPGAGKTSITYAQLVGGINQFLYSPQAFEPVTELLGSLWTLQAKGSSAADRKEALKTLAKLLAPPAPGPGKADPEAPVASFVQGRAIICSDGRHAANPSAWPRAAATLEPQTPFFTAPWSWIDAVCATDFWTAKDEDAYRGPFDRSTAAPVLIVGSRWDNATNYESALAVSRFLPNSQLLTSENWGHTAYSASACAAREIDRYLITARLPQARRCPGDVQPFARR